MWLLCEAAAAMWKDVLLSSWCVAICYADRCLKNCFIQWLFVSCGTQPLSPTMKTPLSTHDFSWLLHQIPRVRGGPAPGRGAWTRHWKSCIQNLTLSLGTVSLYNSFSSSRLNKMIYMKLFRKKNTIIHVRPSIGYVCLGQIVNSSNPERQLFHC